MEYQVTMPFKGISADDRRADRRSRLVGGRLRDRRNRGRRRARRRPRLPGRRPDQALFLRELRHPRRAPERRRRPRHRGDVGAGRSIPARRARRTAPAWLEAFVGAFVDDECLARVLLAETHGGALSPFRHQIIDVAVAGMAPPGSDPQADLRARLAAYAQIGTLSELCLAWHRGTRWRWNGRRSSTRWPTCSSASTACVTAVRFPECCVALQRASAVPVQPDRNQPAGPELSDSRDVAWRDRAAGTTAPARRGADRRDGRIEGAGSGAGRSSADASPSMEDVASLAGAMLKLPDSVVIVDEDGNVAWGNSSAQRLFGRSLADGVGISGLSLVHPDDQELVLRSLTTIQDKEVGDPIEIRVESVTGWRLVEIVGHPAEALRQEPRAALPARPDQAPAFRAGQRP